MAGRDGPSHRKSPAGWMESQPEKKVRGSRFGSRKIDQGYQADGAQKQLRGLEEEQWIKGVHQRGWGQIWGSLLQAEGQRPHLRLWEDW